MESIDREEVRGFRLANQLDPGAPQFMVDAQPQLHTLDAQSHQLLCDLISLGNPNAVHSFPNQVRTVDEIALRGVCYATLGSSKFRSSKIIFQLPDNPDAQRAGAIQEIFQYAHHCNDEEKPFFYMCVQEYSRLDIAQDPYPQFGFAGGFLCEAQRTTIHVIELSQVVSHFALTTMKGKYDGRIHAMPLDKVCCK